jgi:orotidine-5'-phosphate decarboxylase
MNKHTDPIVIVALDFDNKSDAFSLVNQLDPKKCKLKIGKEMFTYLGPDFVKEVVALGFDVFLDLKFHDIPNTVAKACVAAAKLGVWMVNVHASGGDKMMKAAMTALNEFGDKRPLLTAVTVLTSMDQQQLGKVIGDTEIIDQVKKLALLTQDAGLDGIVCSAQEAKVLRGLLVPDFKLVTPGIRPEGADKQDQKRVLTPKEAVNAGVDYLVIGRPITLADQPQNVLEQINNSIA